MFLQYNPYGYETTEWIINLNPQADTNSNNMIYIYHNNSGFTDYFAKGEDNGNQRMAYIDVPPASVEYMTIMEVLPTGNAGGMENSVKVKN